MGVHGVVTHHSPTLPIKTTHKHYPSTPPINTTHQHPHQHHPSTPPINIIHQHRPSTPTNTTHQHHPMLFSWISSASTRRAWPARIASVSRTSFSRRLRGASVL